MRRAELVQVHSRLVAVAQQHPVAVRRLTDAQTLNIQHNAVHTGETGLGTEDTSYTDSPGAAAEDETIGLP